MCIKILFFLMVNIAIFASGSGSNAENIVRYFESHPCISVSLILTNKADAYVLERAKKLNIPAMIFSKTEMNESDSLLNLLIEKKIDWLILAGFLLKVPDNLIAAFPDRILNIHPALLPKHGGKGMYGSRVHEAVVAAGEKESGITIHYVNNHYDEGQIAFQATCPVLPSDSAEDVANKVHALEYEHFPKVIEKIISDSL
ncbi:phosphoribosylglycinamide formyltransferase [Paludibacter sp.]|uniref:phosphoribosylglycinamide formyltransferase n=1 Tax=Paludibacter sp. TaxID=1898105 RepID=UPI0025E94263|nr:phosphoribosylglycinamide formyltransferase [Paludibacter sp.]